MNSHIRDGATILALLASIGFAAAQNAPTGPAGSLPPAKTQDSMSQSSGLQLSAQQKAAIFKTVSKEKLKSPPPADIRLSLGAQIPSSVELYPLPANIVAEVPATKQFKYTIAQNQVVLVDPTNMKVVEIIRQ